MECTCVPFKPNFPKRRNQAILSVGYSGPVFRPLRAVPWVWSEQSPKNAFYLNAPIMSWWLVRKSEPNMERPDKFEANERRFRRQFMLHNFYNRSWHNPAFKQSLDRFFANGMCQILKQTGELRKQTMTQNTAPLYQTVWANLAVAEAKNLRSI